MPKQTIFDRWVSAEQKIWGNQSSRLIWFNHFEIGNHLFRNQVESRRDRAIGDVFFGSESKLLQDPPDSDRRDVECLSYIAESCRPPGGAGVSPRSVSSHRLLAARPSVD
jgi:hypothetical protein